MPPRPIAPAPALILFDIDGTILRRAGIHHKQALEDAVRHVAGFAASIDGIPTHGMLDRDIIAGMLRAGGTTLRQTRQLLPAVMAKAESLYVRRCPDLTRCVTPGVRQLLRRLDERGIPAGLVTGNLSRIGWRKMTRAGLKGHFRFGAFAEQASTRSLLARIAIREARRRGWIEAASVVALIGDHPNDIRAARDNRLRSIAVATGLCSAAELAAHSPDFLLDDLRQFRWHMVEPTLP